MNLPFYRLKLEEAGVAFGPGLTEAEVQAAGESYGIKLPPDLRGFLKGLAKLAEPG